jgi:NADH dehydrogenase FAD-containing subunit
MAERNSRIVVAGAGYAGLLAAVRLAGRTRRLPVDITLASASDLFVERVRLHQLAANQRIRPRPIRDVLRGTEIDFVAGRIGAINLERHDLILATPGGERHLAYDHLVYALGSTIELDGVPGVRENAYRLTPTGPRSAEALQAALPTLGRSGGRMVIVGGGATGIEAAAEFAEAYPDLHLRLVTRGDLGAFLGGTIQSHIARTLRRLGVSIQDNTTVERVDRREVITADGAVIPFDLCLWAGGFVAPPPARDTGLAVNERGQVLIDPFMRSISHPEVYAAGDAASPVAPPGVPVRMAAYTAAILGAHAADCLSDALRGRAPRPLSFAYLGQGIALGRHDAVGFNDYPDDEPKGPVFRGGLAVQIREFFVRLLADAARQERRLPGSFFWPGKRRVNASRRTVARQQS